MKPIQSIVMAVCAASALWANALSVESVEHASLRNDLNGLLGMRVEAEPKRDPFTAAFLEYRIGIAANVAGDEKTAKRSLKASARILEDVLERQPDSVPALALLSSVYGMTIGVSPMQGAFLGRKAQRLIERALAVAPGDPHALLTKGISDYNTPSMFGGSRTAALVSLDKAIDAFEALPQSPDWGLAEAYVWRALTLDDLERRDDAIASLNLALEREPDYAWARFILVKLQGSAG